MHVPDSGTQGGTKHLLGAGAPLVYPGPSITLPTGTDFPILIFKSGGTYAAYSNKHFFQSCSITIAVGVICYCGYTWKQITDHLFSHSERS